MKDIEIMCIICYKHYNINKKTYDIVQNKYICSKECCEKFKIDIEFMKEIKEKYFT